VLARYGLIIAAIIVILVLGAVLLF
jgi:hypothetical protein